MVFIVTSVILEGSAPKNSAIGNDSYILEGENCVLTGRFTMYSITG